MRSIPYGTAGGRPCGIGEVMMVIKNCYSLLFVIVVIDDGGGGVILLDLCPKDRLLSLQTAFPFVP